MSIWFASPLPSGSRCHSPIRSKIRLHRHLAVARVEAAALEQAAQDDVQLGDTVGAVDAARDVVANGVVGRERVGGVRLLGPVGQPLLIGLHDSREVVAGGLGARHGAQRRVGALGVVGVQGAVVAQLPATGVWASQEMLLEHERTRTWAVSGSSREELLHRVTLIFAEHVHGGDEVHVAYNAMQTGWRDHDPSSDGSTFKQLFFEYSALIVIRRDLRRNQRELSR
jgi:hypothetical protein